ncbi:MAG: T9SS type A sorting domain-containing protein [Bacteroidales bacterium]|nr:T9SS type A sorting domain-containing protein [Bacteroidales bacterium]
MNPKTLFWILVTCWIIPGTTLGQISFERSYTNSIYYTHLTDTEEKLFLMDVSFSECRIYNLDHSLYKTTRVHLDPNHWLYDISYVTRHLFNDDDSIEFLYMAYEYFETTEPYYQYMVGVATESGRNLLKVPMGTYYEVVTVDGKNKLLVWLYDNSTWPYFKGTNIYKLETEGPAKTPSKSALLNPAYPNPADGQIMIPYDLGEKANRGDIRIISADGKTIDHLRVDNAFNELLLDVSSYSPGTYRYTVTFENGSFLHSGAFTVVR